MKRWLFTCILRAEICSSKEGVLSAPIDSSLSSVLLWSVEVSITVGPGLVNLARGSRSASSSTV